MSAGPALPSIDTVLRSLRRGARHPREAIEAAVKQLLVVGRAPQRADGPRRTYRVDDLAQASGITVRNIRAYQERGLLPPTQRVGRTAVFDDTHLARLKIIASMLDRGYTASNILEMLTAWEHGRDLGQVLGLEEALVPPAADEPMTVTITDAQRLAGGTAGFELLLAAGLIERAGSKVRLLRPRMLEAFAEMREHGMTTEALVEVHHKVLPAADRIAAILVNAGAAQLAPRFLGGVESGATSSDVGELVDLLTRFRGLAMSAVTATVAASMESAIEELLADYLAAAVLPSAVLPIEGTA